uniref:Uncharacterized protein n=1 Tax=Arundo donax TaxID=35708 RepID=A0A0A9FRW2_ARUDO
MLYSHCMPDSPLVKS